MTAQTWSIPGEKEEGRPSVPVAGERRTDLRGQKTAGGEKVGERAGNAGKKSRKPAKQRPGNLLCSRQLQGHVEMGIGDTLGLQGEYLLARSMAQLCPRAGSSLVLCRE